MQLTSIDWLWIWLENPSCKSLAAQKNRAVQCSEFIANGEDLSWYCFQVFPISYPIAYVVGIAQGVAARLCQVLANAIYHCDGVESFIQ